jgi:hypothetical protein
MRRISAKECFASTLVHFEGIAPTMKPLIVITGFLAAALIVAQLVMGQLIFQGQAALRTAHRHSGYLTAGVTLIYIFWSLVAIVGAPRRDTR